MSGFGIRDSDFGFRGSGFGSQVSDLSFWVSGFGSQVSNFEVRDLKFGFRSSGFGIWHSGVRFQVSHPPSSARAGGGQHDGQIDGPMGHVHRLGFLECDPSRARGLVTFCLSLLQGLETCCFSPSRGSSIPQSKIEYGRSNSGGI